MIDSGHLAPSSDEAFLLHNSFIVNSGLDANGFGRSCKDLEKELKGLESIINLKNRSFEQRLQQLSNDSKSLHQPHSSNSPQISSRNIPSTSESEDSQRGEEIKYEIGEDEINENGDELRKKSKEKREIKKQKFEDELNQLKQLASQNIEKSEFEKIKHRYLQLYEDEKNNNKILKDKIKQLELEVIELNKRLNKQNELGTQKEVQLLNFQRKFPTLLQELELTSSHNSELLREKELLLSQYNDLRTEFIRYKDESYKQRTSELQIKLELEQQNQKLSNEIFTLNNRLTESVLLVSELRGKRERDQEILLQESNKVSSLQQSLLAFERENKQLKLFLNSKFPNFALFNDSNFFGSYESLDDNERENFKLKIELQQLKDELFYMKSTNSSFSSSFSLPSRDNNNNNVIVNNNNIGNNINDNKIENEENTNIIKIVEEEEVTSDNIVQENGDQNTSKDGIELADNTQNHINNIDHEDTRDGEDNGKEEVEIIVENGDHKSNEFVNQVNSKLNQIDDRTRSQLSPLDQKKSPPSTSSSLSPSLSHSSSYSSSSSDYPINSKKKGGKNYNILEKYLITVDGEQELEEKILRPIIYTPVKGDEIDSLLANTISYNLADGLELLPTNFKRLTLGLYQFGTKKIHISVQNGQPVVRVGGGFSSFVKFVQKYGRSECIKITRQSKGFSPIENENTSPVKQILTPLRLKKVN